MEERVGGSDDPLIAGKYFIHLADAFAKKGMVYSSESFDTAEQFLDS